MPGDRRTATVLLQAWRGGDRDALDGLLPVVYDELSGLARRALHGERPDHTLQTRALVHEAYLRLVDADISFQDRAHFMAVAARTMRRVLVDHARARRRDKRGGGAVRVDLDTIDLPAPDPPSTSWTSTTPSSAWPPSTRASRRSSSSISSAA